MAKFCNNCGTQLDDATTFCNNCGTKVESTTPVSSTPVSATNASSAGSAKKLPKLDKSMLKFAIPAVAAIIVLIIIISIIVGNGYKKPFKNLINGINDGDEEVYCDALPDFLIKKYKKSNDDYYKTVKENIKSQIKSWEESKIYDLGDDVEVSYKIVDTIEMDDEALEDAQDYIKSRYDKKVEVKGGYEVAFLITIEGEDGEYSYPSYTTVYKLEGKWCVLDTSFLVNSYTSISDDSDIDYSDLIDMIN